MFYDKDYYQPDLYSATHKKVHRSFAIIPVNIINTPQNPF